MLAEVGLLFTSSYDELVILQRVTEIAVPELADACSVYLTDVPGELERVAIEKVERPIGDASSQIAVPLVVRGAVIGVLTLVRSSPRQPYDHDDLVFAEELARRVAMHVDHARLLADQSRLIAQLEESNRELEQFADITSHDLKTPLRGIGHLATWIEEDIAPWATDGARTHLQLLRDRVRRCEDMIDGILSYSRAGRIIDNPVEVDVAELVTEVICLLDAPANMSIVIEPPLPVIHTARIPLQQVMLNLISNALRHANSEAPTVVIGGAPIEGGWEFFVRDNGQGIDPAQHDRIWQMFRTLRQREGIDGTGIGLSIVRRIVEGVAGRAWVESSPGEGATFRFTWPSTFSTRWRRGPAPA